MTTFNLKYKDRLEDPSNFIQLTCQVQMLLEGHDPWDFVENKVVDPTNLVLLAKHKKKMAKTKGVILNSLKDHSIPRIAGKTTGKEMFDTLVILYQNEKNRKMLLQNNLKATRMSKTDSVATY